jgi:hypothetical protein
MRKEWAVWAVAASVACNQPVPPLPPPSPPTCWVACTSQCTSEEETVCLDSAVPWHACYRDGYQACELQPNATCGWTLLDPEGWDTCVSDLGG